MIWIIKTLFSYDARAYTILVILTILGLVNALSDIIKTFDIIGFVLASITLILSSFLKKRLFPDIPLFGYVPKQQHDILPKEI